MDIKEFLRLIADKDKNLPNLILILGEEDYLISKSIKDLKERLMTADVAHWNLTELSAKNSNLQMIMDISETLPFFGDSRLVIAYDFLDGKSREDEDVFVKWIKDKPVETVLVFAEQGKVDKRKKLYKTIMEAGKVIECKHQSESDLKRWIKGILKKEGKEIEDEALLYLINNCSGSMWELLKESEKLVVASLGHEKINFDLVKSLLSVPLTEDVFKMIDAVSIGKTAEALDLFNQLIKVGQNPVGILALLIWQFRLLYYCKVLSEKGYGVKEIAGHFGTSPYPVQKTIKIIDKFSIEKAKKSFELCIMTDGDIKGGLIKDQTALETLIVKLANY